MRKVNIGEIPSASSEWRMPEAGIPRRLAMLGESGRSSSSTPSGSCTAPGEVSPSFRKWMSLRLFNNEGSAAESSPDHTLAVVGSKNTFVEQKEVLYGLYDLVNKQYVITPEYEDVKCPDFPTRCFATAVMKNGKWGFKGIKGKSEMDTPFLFDDAYPFQPQGAVVLNGFASEIFEDGHISGEWHYIDNNDDDVYIDRDPYSYMDAYEGDPSNIWNND